MSELSQEHRGILLQVAFDSIDRALRDARDSLDAAGFPAEIQARGATFVTLKLRGRLQGCIGSLRPRRALVLDVWENAHAAAFRDPRALDLRREDARELSIRISRLSAPEPLEAASEPELLERIRPGIDGLIVEEGEASGTLLPCVWESLPAPRDFLAHLKLKAGLPANYWSPTLRFRRYVTETFHN